VVCINGLFRATVVRGTRSSQEFILFFNNSVKVSKKNYPERCVRVNAHTLEAERRYSTFGIETGNQSSNNKSTQLDCFNVL